MGYNPLGGRLRKRLIQRAARVQSAFPERSRHSRDARRFVGKMFSHESLGKIPEKDRALLKRIAKIQISSHSILQSTKPLEGANSTERQRKMITITGEGIQGSRSASVAYGERLFGKIDGLIGKFGEISCLDVGAGVGDTLRQIKTRYKSKVKTHSLSYEDEPTHSDFEHVFDAAYFPKEFRQKFHLVISNIAIRYMAMPNYVIENVFRSLIPGGKAELHLQPFGEGEGSTRRYLPDSAVSSFVKNKMQKKYPVLTMLKLLDKSMGRFGLAFTLFPAAYSKIPRELLMRGQLEKVFPKGIPDDFKSHLLMLGDFARNVETIEEIERLLFLQKNGALKIRILAGADPIPESIEFTKNRELSEKDEYYWKRKKEKEPKMTIEEFVQYVLRERERIQATKS